MLALAGAAPAARTSDTLSVPGSIVGPGAATVLICGKPALRAGDATVEAMPAGPTVTQLPGTIATGSSTVLIAGKPAARAGDKTSLGHALVGGCSTVVIGP
jgi:uncharacterized Zn-binding protein involved in type VI secretion